MPVEYLRRILIHYTVTEAEHIAVLFSIQLRSFTAALRMARDTK